MRLFTLLLSLPAFLICNACSEAAPSGTTIPVEYHGALKNIMRKGDLSAQISLNDLQDQPNLYALGALTDLKGEILILNSIPLIASVGDDHLKLDTSFDVTATLLVYARVTEWASTTIPYKIYTKEALERHLEVAAAEQGINTNAPFPFLLRGAVKKADWHVIDWPTGDSEHSHEKHIRSGLFGTIEDQVVEILGFYSKHHHAVFTHHTTNIHMHLRTSDNQTVGHVDDLVLQDDMELLLPVISASKE